MRFIKPSFEIIEQPSGMEGLLSHIELCGRTCYQSHNKITEDSAKKFVDNLIKSGHLSVLEHSTVYLIVDDLAYEDFLERYSSNKYSVVKMKSKTLQSPEDYLAITTNLRVIIENGWEHDLQYMCEPTQYHERRYSVKFETAISISREFNRHRANSASESSTRYCNYSKDKFGNEVSVCVPLWVRNIVKGTDGFPSFDQMKREYFSVDITTGMTKDQWGSIDWWLWSNYIAEEAYLNLIALGEKAQDAREVLPLDTHTSLVHTAFASDWGHFFSLRDANAAHPQARELAEPLHKEFINREYIKE